MSTNSFMAKPGLLLAAFAASFGLGACFDGADAEGLPCDNNTQCGVGQSCVDGYCGGVFRCADGVTLISTSKVCDFVDDCEDGSDEDPAACAEGGDMFACEGEGEVELEFVCDGTPDCEDGSDEDPELCAGIGSNMCAGSDGDLWWGVGPSTLAVPGPGKLFALDVVGSPELDFILLSKDGNNGRLTSFDPMFPTDIELTNYTAGASITDAELIHADASEGPREDLVIATGGDVPRLVVAKNNRPTAPELFGAPTSLEAINGLMNPTLRAVGVGQFGGDASEDAIVIVDGSGVKGRLAVAIGSASAAQGDGEYFTIDILDLTSLDYETYRDVAVTNVNGDELDDVLVAGIAPGGMPTLYVAVRGGMILPWQVTENPLAVPADEIVVGRFDPMAQNEGLVTVNNGGELQTYLLDGSGETIERTRVEFAGSQVSGLTMADLNCDERADFLVNVGSTSEILVFLGSGTGDLFSPAPVRFLSDGTPTGGLGVADFDGDENTDIFSMVDMGNGVTQPQLRVLLGNYVEEGDGAPPSWTPLTPPPGR